MKAKCQHDLCHEIKSDEKDTLVTKLLKDHSLAITKPRKLILAALLKSSSPLTADEIYLNVGRSSCDKATIYRVLNQFLESNLILTVNLRKDALHFEFNNPHHHHHHIICTQCSNVEVIDHCFLGPIEKELVLKGYKNIIHQLQFYGLCKYCA